MIYTWLDQDDDGVITFDDLKRELGGMKREHESRMSMIRTMREKHASSRRADSKQHFRKKKTTLDWLY